MPPTGRRAEAGHAASVRYSRTGEYIPDGPVATRARGGARFIRMAYLDRMETDRARRGVRGETMHQRLLAAAAFVVAAGSATAAPITYDFSGAVNLVRGVPGQGNALVDQLSAIGIGSTFGGSITLDTALGTPGASIPNGAVLNHAITAFTIAGFSGRSEERRVGK